MFDAINPAVMQRTRGRAAVTLGAAPGGARLERLAQAGSAKAMLPRVHGRRPEVVFLNTAGGLTGGDQLSYTLALAPGAQAVATTQTAERAYASNDGAAEMRVQITVGAGGALDWLPQETILFDRASLNRQTEIALGAEARILFCETVVLGRAAMGETLAEVRLHDTRRITRDGVPVLVEPLRIDGAVLAARGDGAVLDGARAMSTIALVGPGAEDALGPVRAALPDDVRAAASAWDGRLIVRLLAPDAWPLRRALVAVLSQLRGGALPRVWQI